VAGSTLRPSPSKPNDFAVELRGIETEARSARGVAHPGGNAADHATEGDAKQREVLASRDVVEAALAKALTDASAAGRFVALLDGRVRRSFTEQGRKRWPFSAKTANNIWTLVRAMFRDACRAKDPSLCVRDDNPADGIAAPDRGAHKAKTYLWPSEFAALVSMRARARPLAPTLRACCLHLRPGRRVGSARNDPYRVKTRLHVTARYRPILIS
jgi:hypothetical protein